MVAAAGHTGGLYVFHPGYAQDSITGFVANGGAFNDVIDLRGFGIANYDCRNIKQPIGHRRLGFVRTSHSVGFAILKPGGYQRPAIHPMDRIVDPKDSKVTVFVKRTSR
jgi:hypothetical protein